MSEPTLQQEIEALRPATEGTLRQMASVYIDSAAIMASVQAMMESVGQIMDSAKTAFDGIMVDEGVDLNG
jgi:hypothetical protein